MNTMDSQSVKRGFELVRAGMDRLANEMERGTTVDVSLHERMVAATALPERASTACDLLFALRELMQLETCACQASPKLQEILGGLEAQEKDGR